MSNSITGSENLITLDVSRRNLSSEQFQKMGRVRLAGHKLPSVRDQIPAVSATCKRCQSCVHGQLHNMKG
jgi:hypothetical protein